MHMNREISVVWLDATDPSVLAMALQGYYEHGWQLAAAVPLGKMREYYLHREVPASKPECKHVNSVVRCNEGSNYGPWHCPDCGLSGVTGPIGPSGCVGVCAKTGWELAKPAPGQDARSGPIGHCGDCPRPVKVFECQHGPACDYPDCGCPARQEIDLAAVIRARETTNERTRSPMCGLIDTNRKGTAAGTEDCKLAAVGMCSWPACDCPAR